MYHTLLEFLCTKIVFYDDFKIYFSQVRASNMVRAGESLMKLVSHKERESDEQRVTKSFADLFLFLLPLLLPLLLMKLVIKKYFVDLVRV